MSFQLKKVCQLVDKSVRVLNDCSFDNLYLVGKPFPKEGSPLSYLTGKDYIDAFLGYNIVGVICTQEIADELQKKGYEGGIAISDYPKVTFFSIHNYFAGSKEYKASEISPKAEIHPLAIIAERGVIIGDNTKILANAVIKEGTVIGKDCIIREGCVLGSPAFYYFGDGDKKTLVESTGGIIIGDNVELHTNVTVEKGVLGGNTTIGDNTKVDNVSLIGHDSIIGKNVTMAASATLAGGVALGDGCFLGVGVTIAPSVKCGRYVKLSAGAVATKDIPEGVHASGNFAVSHENYLQFIKGLSK